MYGLKEAGGYAGVTFPFFIALLGHAFAAALTSTSRIVSCQQTMDLRYFRRREELLKKAQTTTNNNL